MEVVEGTEADRKGGHIARRRADGQLVLRETAQTPPEDEDSFRDFRALALLQHQQPVGRPARARRAPRTARRGARAAADRQPQDGRPARRRLDAGAPARERDGGGDRAVCRRAQLLCVPRTRFVPVKRTEDLLVLRSDVYTLVAELLVEPVPERAGKLPFVELDAPSTGCSRTSRRASRTGRRRCARPSG